MISFGPSTLKLWDYEAKNACECLVSRIEAFYNTHYASALSDISIDWIYSQSYIIVLNDAQQSKVSRDKHS
jgi:hypothetical protein